MDKSKGILFVVPYPIGRAPSQRFRVEQFLPLLDERKIRYKLATFMDANTWDILYKGGSPLQKVWGICKGFLKRWKHVLIDVPQYDVVFIHREAAPIGPPVFEWLIAKVWRKKIVYDFDDAIWIPNTSQENKLAASLKCFWKVPRICKWASIVTGGNDYLCDYARNAGSDKVILLPTVVDTIQKYNRLRQHTDTGTPVIGWTGSHSTLKYLDEVVPLLQRLETVYEFEFLVIADKNPDLPLRGFRFLPWNESTEIDDLLKIDIGIMPLTNDKWSEGKCGFKLIQYMALGIPVVASPVGVNKVIVDNDINGYCAAAAEWPNYLKQLISDPVKRNTLGKNGRDKIVNNFSIESQREKFLDLF